MTDPKISMTTTNREVRRRHQVLTVAACGVLLGAVDLLLQRTLPYPWANLANSSAVWALGAFGIGWWLRAGWWRSALAGIVLLVVAVQVYHLTAAVVMDDDVQMLWSPTGIMWSAFGVLAGALFGAAGGLTHDRRPWLRPIAVAMPGAVLLAEAAMLVDRSDNPGRGPNYRTDSLQTAAIEAILGVALILLVARTNRVRLLALTAAIVLAAIGFAGFTVAGFGD
ncbi:DUF6518 family protein [Micromonospora mirobrigensis]|uniref:Uncharacterized protein n=1 Tax=Micromonospora mirobrigensis TaxID=262898 RepID=A0A1C4UWE9_9ACTN|nr:DUF6518 family protein [Micromonospora mirobrigensis]SCE75994.1 hypothetical protein GA0070564_101766 [Micromonospora mirobrigensis]